MAAAAGRHEQVGFRNAELVEKHRVHVAVIVLAGVNDLERQLRLGL
jgi:hypothetical protein